MVFNTFIKCQVCGCITRVRLQVGWQEEHPIEVTCGKCGTSLSGKVKIGQDCPGLNFSFDNADDAQDENADYVVECSPLWRPLLVFIYASPVWDSGLFSLA